MFKKGRCVREAGGGAWTAQDSKGFTNFTVGARKLVRVCEQGRGRLWPVTDSQATEGSVWPIIWTQCCPEKAPSNLAPSLTCWEIPREVPFTPRHCFYWKPARGQWNQSSGPGIFSCWQLTASASIWWAVGGSCPSPGRLSRRRSPRAPPSKAPSRSPQPDNQIEEWGREHSRK